MSPFYIFLYKVIDSLYLPDFYRKVAQKEKGYGFRYLSILAVIAASIIVFHTHVLFNNFLIQLRTEDTVIAQENSSQLAQKLAFILKKFPAITLHDGKASIDEEQPYIIKDLSGKTWILIDTRNDDETISTSEHKEAFITVRKHHFTIQKEKFLWNIHQDKVIDYNSLVASLPILKNQVLIGMGIFSFMSVFIQVFVTGFLGYITLRWIRIPISYQTVTRLASFSITPLILLRVLDGTLGPSLLVSRLSYGPLSFFVSFGYFYFALASCFFNKPPLSRI